MGPYAWCAIGAVVGWLAVMAGGEKDFVKRVESVAVGIFGAFIGGEFIPSVFMQAAPKGAGLALPAITLAIVCSVAGVLLLRLMQKAVGPLKPGKKRKA